MKTGENKLFFLIILSVVVVLSMVSIISANFAVASIGGPKTLVAGQIYYASDDTPVVGATVIVKCNHNNILPEKEADPVVSGSDGTYFVVFNQYYCDQNDLVTVSATTTDGLTGMKTGRVHNGVVNSLDVAIVNVPMVPEYGLLAGITTVLGACGTFFIIRKKARVSKKKLGRK
jgi:hypothetical protein